VNFRGKGEELTDERVAWFFELGWHAASHKGDVIASLLVEIPKPDACYHATPACNEKGISERGLLTGLAADCSTTRRPDAIPYIHVSHEVESAAAWVTDALLKKGRPKETWLVLRIREIVDASHRQAALAQAEGT
jgi:hypothetical protein